MSEKTVDDLAESVKRLAQALRKAAPDNPLPNKALGYLKRHDLLGTTLRIQACREGDREIAMSELRARLIPHTIKPEEITGDTDTKNSRVEELVQWMARYNEGYENPKWLAMHATELAHYVAEIKNL